MHVFMAYLYGQAPCAHGGQKRVSDLLNLGVRDGHEQPVWAFAENLTTPLKVQQARSTTKLSLLP